MEEMDFEIARRWFRNLAIGLAIIVGILSWRSGVNVFWLIVRMVLAFITFYLLCYGSLTLFLKTAPPAEETEEEQGRLLDVVVGEGEKGVSSPEPEIPASGIGLYKTSPGQVKPDLLKGLPDPKQQADIVRRMGWGDEEEAQRIDNPERRISDGS
ncbi:MAG: hypothetical protein LBT32_07665 [Peptococcaceae bacterium]|jgi:hypothetical protein|nr:hypothetical protein [Peptococcaceae bacterium]